MGRPVHNDDPLPRDPIVAVKKVLAEGTPTEKLTVLGWELDTRRLLIQLPNEKATLWDTDLKKLIIDGDKGLLIGLKRLEAIQGRNNHVANIVPGARHFQSRMYAAIKRAKTQHGRTRLHAEERRDLHLLRHLLHVARRGISLNCLVIRLPDHMGRSDAYEKGIGGYDLTSGRAWRLPIPKKWQLKKSQNFLEYLACMVQLLCLLYESNWQPGDSFLSIGDNTSALGWIWKSKFYPETDPEQATHLALARYMTLLLADLDVVQFGLWLPGIDNGVADALSRQFEKTDNELTDFITSSYPSQTPPGFQIKALPRDNTLWALYWVRHSHVTKESPPVLRPKGTHGGDDGSSFSITANSKTMSISDSSHHMNVNSSLEHSPTRPAAASGQSPRKAMITWLREHAVPQSTRYVRPSAQPVGMIPAKTRTANLYSFYGVNFEDTRTQTPQKNHRKRSHSDCSKN
jgi:hypothetical protein